MEHLRSRADKPTIQCNAPQRDVPGGTISSEFFGRCLKRDNFIALLPISANGRVAGHII